MIDVALIGAGRMGAVHGANAGVHNRLRLKIIVDADRTAAGALASRIGAGVAGLEEMLADEDVAGVIIASPTSQHLDQAIRCAAAGKAVLVEKPVDLDPARARAALEHLAGGRTLVGFNRRFDPHFRALKARLDDGTAGDLETLHIISHDPAPPPIAYVAVSGGIFKDMAIHDLDMARWLTGEEPTEVFAFAACLVDPAIGAAGDFDTARTLVRFASGRLAMISNSRRSGHGYDQRIEAFGAAGMVRAGNVATANVEVWSESGAAAAPFHDFFLDRYQDAYRAELDHFADVIEGAAPRVTFADGLAALDLAEAAGRSARTGAAVKVAAG